MIIQEAVEPKQQTIRDDILTNIQFSKFIIAEITGEGIRKGQRFNPNCVYELGYAHAKGKKVIATVRRDMAFDKRGKSHLPFDFSGIKFDFWEEGKEEELRGKIEKRLDELEKQLQREY